MNLTFYVDSTTIMFDIFLLGLFFSFVFEGQKGIYVLYIIWKLIP